MPDFDLYLFEMRRVMYDKETANSQLILGEQHDAIMKIIMKKNTIPELRVLGRAANGEKKFHSCVCVDFVRSVLGSNCFFLGREYNTCKYIYPLMTSFSV